MLFKPWIQRSEAGIQTEFQTGVASKHKLELAKSQSIEMVPDGDENDFDLESEDERLHQKMDEYKDDWVDSLVFKQAIRAEKMKRGLPVEDDDQENTMSAIEPIDNSQDANSQE